MMNAIDDPVYRRFMARQMEEGLELARSSDIMRLRATPISPPTWVADFYCKGLVRDADGEIREGGPFSFGIWFPPDYLRRVDGGFEVLRALTPIWHPNVSDTMPLVCIGRVTPGTPLTDILFRLYDLVSYQSYNPREDDSLNKAACQWARANQHRFPIDRRPLKRRVLHLEVREI